jgi:hypothetical protein
VAVTDANINVLLINPQTGQLLATTTDPVLPGSKLPADGKTTLCLSMGWTNSLTAP